MSIPLALLGSGKSAKNGDARQVLAVASVPPAGMARLQEPSVSRSVSSLHTEVYALSQTSLGQDWAGPLIPPLLISLPHLDMKLIALFPT